MASKYGYRINTNKATKDKLVEFVKTTMYLIQDLIDNSLWAVFLEQFEGFTIKNFKKIHTDIKSKL